MLAVCIHFSTIRPLRNGTYKYFFGQKHFTKKISLQSQKFITEHTAKSICSSVPNRYLNRIQIVSFAQKESENHLKELERSAGV